MKLTGLHLLLTYKCNFECDHCFVWGSPWQSGTFTLAKVRNILKQAEDLGTVNWIYFEGGEPFLYYAVLRKAVEEAASMGFQVGIVSNGYWATDVEDALEWLTPFKDLIQDLSISSDLYHWSEKISRQAQNAGEAAKRLDIPSGVITIDEVEEKEADAAFGQLPLGESAVMFRGRAVEKLVPKVAHRPWELFTECPYEDLREPGRVHVDPFGNVHICQGISLGNLFSTPLRDICDSYDADAHPITGPLLEGGPVVLVNRY
jgi:MoaA/NifB/PqqE/SkfB family radical SAM enzyme